MRSFIGWTPEYHGGIFRSGSSHSKAYIASFGHGQKPEYGKVSLQPWLSRIWWTKQRWCWTALRSKSTSTSVGSKKRILWKNRSEQRGLDRGSPCGNRWTWEIYCIFCSSLGIETMSVWHRALLESFDLNGKLIRSDKGYGSDKFVSWLEKRGGIAVTPSRIIAKHLRKTDWHTYKERHLLENLFLKLKNNRCCVTRYEKKVLYFCAVICFCLVTLTVLKQTLA